jgi:hypothetical protein
MLHVLERLTDDRRLNMTEREKFMTRLAEAREAGLVDLKFFFQPSKALRPEEIFAAINQVEDAIKGGNCVRHSKWVANDPAEIIPHA